uniref:Amino acid transporter transmembrane domain-containing protein n=1 Tax=Oryza meridionalis TaxID=40149 RepID=A0A0E0DQJ7_9ORYZ
MDEKTHGILTIFFISSRPQLAASSLSRASPPVYLTRACGGGVGGARAAAAIDLQIGGRGAHTDTGIMVADKSPIDEALLHSKHEKIWFVTWSSSSSSLPTWSSNSSLPTAARSASPALPSGRSCLNFSNVISGYAGGWLSLALFAMVGAICFYTSSLIDRCMRADRCVRSYPDIDHLAFGGYGRTAIGLIMYAELYLIAISFLILKGDNLDKLLPGTVVEILGYQVHGKQLFVLTTASVILPTT